MAKKTDEMGRGSVTVPLTVHLTGASLVIARVLGGSVRPHNPKVGSSNLPPATKSNSLQGLGIRALFLCPPGL